MPELVAGAHQRSQAGAVHEGHARQVQHDPVAGVLRGHPPQTGIEIGAGGDVQFTADRDTPPEARARRPVQRRPCGLHGPGAGRTVSAEIDRRADHGGHRPGPGHGHVGQLHGDQLVASDPSRLVVAHGGAGRDAGHGGPQPVLDRRAPGPPGRIPERQSDGVARAELGLGRRRVVGLQQRALHGQQTDEARQSTGRPDRVRTGLVDGGAGTDLRADHRLRHAPPKGGRDDGHRPWRARSSGEPSWPLTHAGQQPT